MFAVCSLILDLFVFMGDINMLKIRDIREDKDLTQKQINDALDQCYNNIVTIAGKPFTEAAAIFQLGRLYKNNPELIQACKKSLQDYINNKQK